MISDHHQGDFEIKRGNFTSLSGIIANICSKYPPFLVVLLRHFLYMQMIYLFLWF